MGQLVPKAPAPSLRGEIMSDVVRGAIQGDFAQDLGLPGAVTQVALRYLPVVGTVCAFRDAAADKRRNDAPGVVLNLLSAFPLVGGVAKTAEVLRHSQRLKRGFAVTYRRHRRRATGATS
jgi:hypothetical protein